MADQHISQIDTAVLNVIDKEFELRYGKAGKREDYEAFRTGYLAGIRTGMQIGSSIVAGAAGCRGASA